ncbi:MAG: glycoside hydrolase TIM-barrel-like domain-containing protein [Pseudomonadota bacterium]
MASIVLSSVGASLGSSIGGSLLGVGAATIGQAAGGLIGGALDNQLLGPGSVAREGPRLEKVYLSTSTEGSAIPKVWGRSRVAAQVIWASRFTEVASTTSQGGKGSGARVTTYSYTVSFAASLCEGPIDRIGRVWIDGSEVPIADLPHRLYTGTEDQLPDSAIEAIEGAENAPAYRGIAYLVFEDLDLTPFGNRVPQLSVEVYRRPPALENTPRLEDQIRAVALGPGTGEFSLATTPVRRVVREGVYETENTHSASETADVVRALDQLQASAPNVESVSLILSWFGSDLRAEHCQIRPGVERRDRDTAPLTWSVAGASRGSAHVISADESGAPSFGGTPSDNAVIEVIRELKARGLRVLIYPFLLMDVPDSNALPDPWSEPPTTGQGAFPWRGRITLDRAPGVSGTTDQTAAAAASVDAFFGTASASDFSVTDGFASYSGPDEWRFRRHILHCAALAAAAGGVDAFAIGSEMRSLTHIRSAPDDYPAVAALKSLADEVRTLLGPSTQLTYAADWSEYFGHQPVDGSGDVYFHLDPLWADPNIDAVGIDNYLPLADLTGGSDDDASLADDAYLSSQVEGGEGYEWYYATQADRVARQRSPITDGAYGEPWVFRPKDIRNWWSKPHHNRRGGVRDTAPTEWVPGSKPIWFTEIGCPALDTGPNQPNVFYDPKSSESALPYFSRGIRSDFAQRQYLEAALSYWQGDRIPISDTGTPMLDPAQTHVWTWDARPWPDFPLRTSIWRDSANYRFGHWINGRLGAIPLKDVIADVCIAAGLSSHDLDLDGVMGTLDGLIAERLLTGRETLQPILLAHGIDAHETGGRLSFVMRGRSSVVTLSAEQLVVDPTPDTADHPLEVIREDHANLPSAVQISYRSGDGSYEVAAVETAQPDLPLSTALTRTVAASELPLVLSASGAEQVAKRWLGEAIVFATSARLVLPPSNLAIEPTDVLTITTGAGAETLRIGRIAETGERRVEAVRTDASLYVASPSTERSGSLPKQGLAAPPNLILLDVPALDGSGSQSAPLAGAFVSPWQGTLQLHRSDRDASYVEDVRLSRPLTAGRTTSALAAGRPWRFQHFGFVDVLLSHGALESRDALSVLNGANLATLEVAPDIWELVQFATASLIAPDHYRLSGLLRGQGGTEDRISPNLAAGARFVLLDGALQRSGLPSTQLGLERFFRAVRAGRPVDGFDSALQIFTTTGQALRPLAPVHLRTRRTETNALALSWTRRTRVDGDLWDGEDVPLGEETERYRVTLTPVAGAAQIYTTSSSSMEIQAAEVPIGSAELRIAQVSATVGEGVPLIAHLTLS